MRLVSVLLFAGAILAFPASAGAQDIDWQKVDDALGRKPAVVAGDVHRYGFPRTDLTVMLDGVTIKPALALGGWVAFKPMGSEVMAMGDLVLLENRDQPGAGEDDRQRSPDYRRPQSSAARQSGDLLH